jgi:hypothetical protein
MEANMPRDWIPQCPCDSGEEGNLEYDARGIPLGYMCSKCRTEKLSHYRKDVLEDPNYDCDEDIDGDEPGEGENW